MTAIGDIAKDLGISKGTIVHHYGSKIALLEKVQSDFMKRRLIEGHAVLERFDDPIEALTAMFYILLLIHREDRDAALSFTREISRFVSDPSMESVRALRNEYFDLIRNIVGRGIRSGQFRDEDPAMVTFMIFGMCNWMWTWFKPDGRWEVEEIADTFSTIVLAGLISDGISSGVDPNRREEIAAVARDLMQISGRATPG
jgi:TetR/AcrR family transcriptional regulator, cholesterol catabolism regulator